MSFAEKFLKSLTDLFLGLHWIAAFYAVIESMLPIFALPIYYVAGFLFIPLFFAPAGPLSLTLFDLLGLMIPFYFLAILGAHFFIALEVAAGIVILKFFIYSAIRRNRVLGVPAARILIAYTVIILLTMTSVLLAFLSYFPSPEIMPVIALVYTVPMDLVVFSYVKLRDAVSGVESEKWIPALVALWTAMLWPMLAIVIVSHVLLWARLPNLLDSFAFIFISARAAITALQLSYIALYVRGGGAVVLKSEKSIYAAQTAAASGG